MSLAGTPFLGHTISGNRPVVPVQLFVSFCCFTFWRVFDLCSFCQMYKLTRKNNGFSLEAVLRCMKHPSSRLAGFARKAQNRAIPRIPTCNLARNIEVPGTAALRSSSRSWTWQCERGRGQSGRLPTLHRKSADICRSFRRQLSSLSLRPRQCAFLLS